MTHRYLIGIGNETMTDDGIGPRVARALSARASDFGFEPVVVGHDAIGVLAFFEKTTERILFIDCVRMGKKAGEYTCFSPDEVESRKRLDHLSTHESDVLKIIEMGRQLGCSIPEIRILGIEPDRIEPGLDLSQALEGRMEEYIGAAVAEMRRAESR